MTLQERALQFATRKHSEINQKRKYTNEDYIVHPVGVAKIIMTIDHTPEMIAAAYLHDTVEDTKTTLAEIQEEFGPTVATYVRYLTDISVTSDGNRAKRKEIDRQHISHAPPCVQSIKLADLIHNSKTIVKFDPEFARVYMKEKTLLLEVLKDGDIGLWKNAKAIVDKYNKLVEGK